MGFGIRCPRALALVPLRTLQIRCACAIRKVLARTGPTRKLIRGETVGYRCIIRTVRSLPKGLAGTEYLLGWPDRQRKHPAGQVGRHGSARPAGNILA